MAKYLVETYYTCNFKVEHYLDDVNENELQNLEKREDGKFEILDIKLDNRKTKNLDSQSNNNQNSYTYKELLHSADNLGKKISKRTTVFLVCKNSYEFMISYIALIRKKVVFFLINNSINKEKFKYLINHYKPIYILTPDEKNISGLKLKELFNLNKRYKLLKTNFQK